jgi:hypothetical protein
MMFGKIALFLFALFGSTIAHAQAPDCPPLAGLKLTVGEYHISLNDNRPICVELPGSFTIKIVSPPGLGFPISSGDVTVEGKGGGDVTIDGDNEEAPINKLKVVVDGTADEDDIFEFWIRVAGVGELDPKVRVVDSTVIEMLKSEDLYDTLDTLDLTLEEANKLKPPRPEAE